MRQAKIGVVIVMKHEEGPSNTGLLVEQLRYAGVLQYTDKDDGLHVLIPMSGHIDDQSTWAKTVCRRIRSFGLRSWIVSLDANGRAVKKLDFDTDAPR